MSEATVTIKLAPVEFDLVREAVVQAGESAKKDSQDSTLSASVRSKIRTKHVQLHDLSQRLGA